MRMLLFLMTLLALPCLAQGTLTLSPPSNPRAGSTAIWMVALSGGTSPAALQWSFGCDHPIGIVTVAAGGAAATAQKTISAAPNGNTIISALNQTPMPDGTVANISVALPAALANVNLTCTIQGAALPAMPALGASPAGNAIAETANPPLSVLILPSLSFCDIDGNGRTDATDVTLERTAVLNQTPADRNGDGKTDVVDLQIVTNAALGLGCSATQ